MSSTRGHKFKFSIGEHVLCFEPDPTKARVLYDAKVLEARVRIDKYGRNQVEYHIHFLRWNQSWDRLVSENLILRKNDENNYLMRRLADIARKLKTNRQRKRKIDILLKRAFPDGLFRGGNASTDDDDEASSGKEAGSSTDTTNNSGQNKSNNAVEEDSDISDDDDDDDEYDDDNDESIDDETDDDDTKPAVEEDVIPEEDYVDSDHIDVPLPHVLMDRLDLDWYLINKEKKLVKLPAEPNVISVLESYVRHFAVTTLSGSPDKSRSCNKKTKFASEKSIPLCKEVVDGLRILFDFTLPIILLYGAEREQLKLILETFKPKHMPLSPLETLTPVIKKEPQSPDRSEKRKIPSILQLRNITSPPDLSALSGSRRSSSRLQAHSPTSEPQAKVPKILSPRSPLASPITRTEAESSTSHDEFPSRRVTRHSISECSRKSIDQPQVGRRSSGTKSSPDGSSRVNGVDKNANSSNKDKKSVDISSPLTDDDVKVTRSGRRHSGATNSNTANVSSTVYTSPAHGQSLFERLETIVKEAKQSTPPPSSNKKKAKKRLSLRRSPPASTAQTAPAALTNESKPTVSSGSSATSSGNMSTVQFRNWKESQLNEALSWQLLPQVYAQMTPPSPSVVYGAHHLLRLFVKLPSLLGHMKMSQQKLDCLLKHLHLFLEFLASKHEDLLPSKVYVRDV